MGKSLCLLLVIFVSGCYGRYERPECLTLCEECGIVDCVELCDRVGVAWESDVCHVEGAEQWLCMREIGCDFPLQCRAEYVALFACEP